MYPVSPRLPFHPGCHITLSSFLCCLLLGPCWLSILNITEHTDWAQTPHLTLPHAELTFNLLLATQLVKISVELVFLIQGQVLCSSALLRLRGTEASACFRPLHSPEELSPSFIKHTRVGVVWNCWSYLRGGLQERFEEGAPIGELEPGRCAWGHVAISCPSGPRLP